MILKLPVALKHIYLYQGDPKADAVISAYNCATDWAERDMAICKIESFLDDIHNGVQSVCRGDSSDHEKLQTSEE